MRNMSSRDMLGGGIAMALLIIEKDISAKRPQEGTLRLAAEKDRLVDAYVPGTKGAYHPLMRGGGTGSDQRRPDRCSTRCESLL